MSFFPLPDITLSGSTPGNAVGESVELLPHLTLPNGDGFTVEVRLIANGYLSTSTRVIQSFVQRFAVSRTSSVTSISASDTQDQFGDAGASSWTMAVTVGSSPDRLEITFTTGSTTAITNVTADVFVTKAVTPGAFPAIAGPDTINGFLVEWRGDYATIIPNSTPLANAFWTARLPTIPNSHYIGSNARVASVSSPNATINNLGGITSAMVGQYISLSGSATAGNNGTFLITSYISSSSVQILNPAAAVDTTLTILWNIQNFGSGAGITTFSSPSLTITGLSGMSSSSVGQNLTLYGAASSGNNGTFTITSFISASSVVVSNSNGVASDANSGHIAWGLDDYYLENTLAGGNLSGDGNNWLLTSPWVNGHAAIAPGSAAGWTFWGSGGSYLSGDPVVPTGSSGSQVEWTQLEGASGLTIYIVLALESLTPTAEQCFFSIGGGPTSIQYQLRLTTGGVLSLEDYTRYPSSNMADYYIDTYTAPGSMTSPGILMFQSQHQMGHVVEWNRTALTTLGTQTGGGGATPAFFIEDFPSFWRGQSSGTASSTTLRATFGHIIVFSAYHTSAQKTAVYAYINSFWGL
jgi:hypothetical protein